MNRQEPDLLTLLSWSQRLAAREPCAEWEAWHAASPAAAWQWPRIALATELLAAELPAGEPELPAGEVAALLDRTLDSAQLAALTEHCWESSALLTEVASGAQFGGPETILADVSPALTQRLLALGPQPARWRLDGVELPVGIAVPPAKPVTVLPAVRSRPVWQKDPADNWRVWVAIGAAAAAVLIIGIAGWLATLPRHTDRGPQPVAKGPQPAVAPSPAPPVPQPPMPQPQAPKPRTIAPAPATSPTSIPGSAPGSNVQPSIAPPAAPPVQQPPVPAPKRKGPAIPPRPSAPVKPPPLLAFRPAVGAMLVQGQGANWRVAGGERRLEGPLRIVSLADSWTAVDVPGVGTIICDGPADALLAPNESGGLEILLAHGRLGVQDLAAHQELRVQTANARWTARGMDHYSTLAVLADPAAPQLLVPAGAVAIDQVNVAANQRVIWQNGLLQPPLPIIASPAAGNAAMANSAAAFRAIGDPLDVAWLKPPDEDRRKQFQAQHGKLVERLAAADDAAGELTKLIDASKDARTAALLARWNAALADDAGRAAQTWAMLGDRRVFVRLAGVRSLLELAPSDPRLTDFDRLVRRQAGDGVAQRLQQWLVQVRQPQPLPPQQALELVDFLTHSELPLRQLAVSLLELHAAPTLAQLQTAPPPYDAAGPAARRAAAQQEWRMNLRRIFAPKNVPAVLAPNAAAAGS